MAGRSFLRRLLGSRSAVEFDDASTAPSPGGFTPVPYPNTADGDGPAADSEPTAFDEADAVFGTRTEVPRANSVAPTESTSSTAPDKSDMSRADTSDSDLGEGIVGPNEIISPNNVVAASDDGARALIADVGTAEGIIAPNNVVDSADGSAGRDLLSPDDVIADPDDGAPALDESIASQSIYDGLFEQTEEGTYEGFVAEADTSSSGSVDSRNHGPDDRQELVDAAPDKSEMIRGHTSDVDPVEEIIGSDEIISPNNVVDPDDDLVLVDLSGGSVGDQLIANAGISLEAGEFGLSDDLDAPDDVDVD